MAEIRYPTRAGSQTRAEIDLGLRSYMMGVYNYMALGVALTAAIVMLVASNPAALAAVFGLKWVLFIATLGLGFFAHKLIFSGNTAMAHAAYWGYAGLWGLMIAPMVGSFLAVRPEMVFQAFLVTAVTFGATSLAGYVTKRDLSGFGSFFLMASIGIIVAMLANYFFFQIALFSLVTSIITVLLFSAVTAYETQQIKEMYVEGDAPGLAKGKSIFGAFMLYGSFVTLFIHILNIFGIMGGEE
jgi:FtsH-binding integral membrane protein